MTCLMDLIYKTLFNKNEELFAYQISHGKNRHNKKEALCAKKSLVFTIENEVVCIQRQVS